MFQSRRELVLETSLGRVLQLDVRNHFNDNKNNSFPLFLPLSSEFQGHSLFSNVCHCVGMMVCGFGGSLDESKR